MKKGLLLWLLLAIGMVQAFAQTRTIKGKVTDAQDGSPLPGVSVSVKGAKTGAVSGVDGTFSIQVDNAASLVFSFVGYEQKEEKIGNRQSITVALNNSNKILNEVIVTGYGELKRKDVTSSVTAVSGALINDRPTTSFDQALTGRAAGVNIGPGSGVLGDVVKISIRGVNSISNSNQPLIIVDGIPMNTNTNLNVFNSGNGTRYNPLADINPNDIETVDVLKDAAATALYGSRAAAGVIVITTKRGKTGTININYNGYVGAAKAARLPKVLNGDDFNTIQNEKAANSTRAGNPIVPIAKDIDLNGDGKPDRTDWLKETFQTGIVHSHQLSLSGGTEKAKFYASGEYSDQKGIVITNRLRRGGMRVNLDVTPKKWLKSGISLYASKTLNNGVLSDSYLAGSTSSSFSAPPNVPVYDKNGELYIKASNGDLGDGGNTITPANRFNRFFHPLSNVLLGRNDNTSTRVLSSAYVEVEPIPGLKFTSRFSVDFLQNFEDQYSGPKQAGNGIGLNGLVQENLLRKNQWNWSNYATYTKSINDIHFINATLGVESQYAQEKSLYTGQGNLADSYFKEIYDGLYAGVENSFTGGGNIANAFNSYFGKVGYNYGSKYYFDATLRADAYSDFGINNRRGYFPGASIGWRVSEEGFFKDNVSVISDLKLRASYGLVGNSNIRAYAYRTLYGGGSYADINGFSLNQVGDPNLKWETSKKLDIGIDVALLKNRITVTADYFNSNIDNLILDAPILATVGTPWNPVTNVPGSILTTNIGAMWNRGAEFTINTRNIETKDFTWSSSLNFTYIKNKVTATADGSDISAANNRASIGRTLGVFKLVEWGGVNPDNGFPMFYNKNHELVMYNPTPGVANKWTTPDGKTNKSPISSSDAQYQDKSGYPTFFGGLNNTFTYKGIDLSIFLQYSGGNYVYNATRAALMTTFFGNNLEEIKDRWTPDNKNTDVPKLFLADATITQASTRWLEKANFVRAREISLGYTFPSVKRQLGVNTLRVYALVQNAFIITKYKGADPEINTNRTNNINYGVDNRGVPMPRVFTFGLNVGF
ncbi:MAG: TonB-dependent receptor [Chitinophaga sp.]|uniref:SusC/RagA family TonB-linked outer membrane protein n=1 Tax=Chitinophaga sp. TaxID=1869181 RepID=UPI001B0351E6|nr:TonB-dependent receptor [Chitinophaga sp.]MBO9727298.1 TonB-dependent receptor [Chitinophaga sp.]